MPDAPGQIGPYTVEGEIGRGGMGVVYRAHDPKLGRTVAIKVLPAQVTKDPHRVERFRREAQILGGLNHPNIVTVHDVGTDRDVLYVVTELLEGATLRERLASGRLEPGRAVEIGAAVADGLAAAHARGIVHRDLKPDNIYLTRDGVVKILDFGLARHTDETSDPGAPTQVQVTAPGMLIGTAGYMAPEQVKGERADARTDVFAFGCLLYEMLTGRGAFKRETLVESMTAVLNEQPAPARSLVDDLPPGIDRLLSRCLEKEPEERFQSARDLAFTLRGSGAAPAGAETSNAASSAHPARWVLIALALVVLAAAFGWWLSRNSGANADSAVSTDEIGSVVVLPFGNASDDAEMDFLGDGIAESVINRLARLADLRVIPRNTAFRYRGRDAEVEAVATELDVRGVVTGRVSRRNDRLVVGVELTDAGTVSQLWGERFDTPIDEILQVESEIARRITDALEITLSGEQAALLGRLPTEVPAAHLAFIEARHAWNSRSMAGFQRSLELYDRAVTADPDFALAHAAKAETYVLMMIYLGRVEDYLERLEAEVDAALRLDPGLAETYPVQGFLHIMEGKWDSARRAFERGIEVDPRYATAYQWYASYLFAIGDLDKRLEMLARARRLDPGSLIITTDYALALNSVGRAEQAETLLLELVETAPEFWRAHDGLGRVYLSESRYREAAEWFERARELSGEIAWNDGLAGMAWGLAGETEKARASLQRLERRAATGYVSRVGLAALYAGLGEMDRAFATLREAVAERDPLLSSGIPRFYPVIWQDPRWREIEDLVGFPGPPSS